MPVFQSGYLSLLHAYFLAQLLLCEIVCLAGLLYGFAYFVCLNGVSHFLLKGVAGGRADFTEILVLKIVKRCQFHFFHALKVYNVSNNMKLSAPLSHIVF